MTSNIDERENDLKVKRVCRFCLSQTLEKLSKIYTRDVHVKTMVPLPVQVMSIASMEVYSNDGMPTWVCTECRMLFDHAYRFKQMCKRAETLLRQYPLTGQWPSPLNKPSIPKELLPKQQILAKKTETTNATQSLLIKTHSKQQQISFNISGGGGIKKILNSNPVSSPEPPAPVRLKKEQLDEKTDDFLSKVENNEELSMDDVQRLIASAVDDDDEEFVGITTTTTEVVPVATSPPKKPKLLNKSSIRILNKEADVVVEPRLSRPQLKRDEDGNVAIVSEILDPNVPYETEPDPIKNAVPVETNVFPCPHCERSFPLLQLRDIHMVNHNRERSYQCVNCDKSFFSKYDLQKHSLIHSGDKPFKCTVCEKAFTRASLLHRHEKSHTDIPKFICIYCEKPFISKDEMEKHTERHRKNRPYQCKVCNKSFAFKQGLERHEVIHSRDQPYPCQYCEQSFSTPSKLARHLTAHAGNRPYPCKFCNKSYLLSHHLTRHLRSHKQGTTLFTCNDCDKVYKTRDELIYHSAVHATQTLVCPLCKESFEDVGDVTLHIRQHAEGEAFACAFCDLIFLTSERLQEHSDFDHAEDMAAYYEDDNKAKSQSTKNDATIAEDAGADNIQIRGDLQQSIDEFLIDELTDEVQILNNQILHGNYKTGESDVVVKEENESNKLQILNQIVITKSKTASDEENYVMLDDNIAVTNEAEEMDDVDAEYKMETQLAREPPIKMKKFYKCGNNKSPADVEIIGNKTHPSPQLRRKVPVPSAETITTAANQNTQIKIEYNHETVTVKTSPEQATINSALNTSPKGVSVCRNASASAAASNTSVLKYKETNSSAQKELPTIEIAKQPPAQQKYSKSRQQLARPAVKNVSPPSRTKPKSIASSVQQQQLHTRSAAKRTSNEANEMVAGLSGYAKSSASTATPPTATASTSKKSGGSGDGGNAKKVVKIMLGDKKVKMQKITMTRAEASAMVKEGRIHIKDGNMILTQNSLKPSK